MGMQATFIKVKEKRNFHKLVVLMKELGKDFFNKKWIYPIWIITLKKSITVNERKFYSGEKFIAIQGQRASQLNAERMFSEYAPNDLEIYALESFPKNIYTKKKKIIKIKNWEW